MSSHRSGLVTVVVTLLALGRPLAAATPATAPSAAAAAAATADDAAEAELDELVEAFTPEDSLVVVRARSAAALERMVFVLRDELGAPLPTDPLASLTRDVNSAIGRLGPDRELPFAVALGLDERDALTASTVFVPFAQPAPEAVVAQHGRGAGLAHGRYAVLSSRSRLQAGGAAVATRGLDGDLSLRADIGAVIRKYRSRIDALLAGIESSMARQRELMPVLSEGVVEAYLAPARMFVDGAETLDVAFSLRGDTLDVDLRIEARAGSALASGGGGSSQLDELARRLLPDLPTLLAAGGGGRFLAQLTSGAAQTMGSAMADELSDEQLAELRAWFERNAELTGAMLDEWAMGVSFGAGSLSSLSVSRIDDAEAFVERYLTQAQAPILERIGMHYRSEGVTDVGGRAVHRLRVRMEMDTYMQAVAGMSGISAEDMRSMMEAWMGPDGAVVELAADGDVVFFASSRDGGLVPRALAGGGVPAPLASALRRVPGELLFAGVIELRELTAGSLEMMAGVLDTPVPSLSSTTPLPIEVALASQGGEYRLGVSLSVTALGDLTRGLQLR